MVNIEIMKYGTVKTTEYETGINLHKIIKSQIGHISFIIIMILHHCAPEEARMLGTIMTSLYCKVTPVLLHYSLYNVM